LPHTPKIKVKESRQKGVKFCKRGEKRGGAEELKKKPPHLNKQYKKKRMWFLVKEKCGEKQRTPNKSRWGKR